MRELLLPFTVSLVLAWLVEYRDTGFAVRKMKKKDHFWVFVLVAYLAIYCGLRTWYNDTVTYLQIYEQTPVLEHFWTSRHFEFATGVGFGFFNSVMKTIGFSSQDYLMFYAVVTIFLYIKFIREYAESFVFSIFLMFATGVYSFTFASVKQCMATAVALWALHYATKKKWTRFFVLILVASLFHPYALIYLFAPFMMFRPWTGWTLFYAVLFIGFGFLIEQMIGSVIDVTTLIGSDYTEEELLGEGVNIFRVLVAFVPMMLAILYHRILFSHSNNSENLMFNLTMMNGLIMFVGIFGTANYFARLANYFLPMQVIVIPWILNRIRGKERILLKIMCVGCYMMYFVYENMLLKRFDDIFNQTGLWTYIMSHF